MGFADWTPKQLSHFWRSAETFAERFRGVPGHPYEQGFDLTLWPSRLKQPVLWKKPRMIFVNSMSDLFHPLVPEEFIRDVFKVMADLVARHRHRVEARAVGRPVVSRYLTRINYRNNLLREGWAEADLEAGGSDRLVDALVLHGTPEDIAAGLTAHLDAGSEALVQEALATALGAIQVVSTSREPQRVPGEELLPLFEVPDPVPPRHLLPQPVLLEQADHQVAHRFAHASILCMRRS